MSARAQLLGALLAGPIAAGCVQLSWNRVTRHSPVPRDALARLSSDPGHPSDLGECLAALGAPLWVWEHEIDGASGAVLAWGWFDERSLGFSASVPITRGVSASFDYDDADARMRGVVLFFDRDWRLVVLRTGLLRDLTGEVRRPPAVLDEEPSGA